MKNPLEMFFRDTKPFGQLVGLAFLSLLGLVCCTGVEYLMDGVAAGDEGAEVRLQLLGGLLQQLLLMLLPSWCFVKVFGKEFGAFFGVGFGGRVWRLAVVSVVVMVLLMPVVDWLSEWNRQWPWLSGQEGLLAAAMQRKAMTERLLSQTGVADVALQVLCICVVPAVCEEFFFRGALQPVLGRCVGNRHVGVWIAAMVFSLVHGDVFGVVPRFALGLLLGYVFELSGSMVVNVCVHFVNNLMVVGAYQLYWRGVVDFDPGNPMGFAWSVVVPCTLCAGLLFYVYLIPQKDAKGRKKGMPL